LLDRGVRIAAASAMGMLDVKVEAVLIALVSALQKDEWK
jgi:hypothetical protein